VPAKQTLIELIFIVNAILIEKSAPVIGKHFDAAIEEFLSEAME
jgi:hypothetical protein